MALQVWLPLTKDLRNQGLSDVTVTNNGATFNSAGKLGGCYNFTTSSYQKIGFPYSLANYTEFTVCVWVKPVSTTITGCLFTFINPNDYWQFVITNSNSVGIRDNSSGETGSRKDYTLGSFVANVWTHLAISYNKGIVKIYKDGVLFSTNNTGGSAMNNYSGTNAAIGESVTSSSSYYFAGSVNDFRIYDHCLSPMEVKQLSKGLVLHYPLNRGGFGPSNLLKNGFGELDRENWGNSNVYTDVPSDHSEIKKSYRDNESVEFIPLFRNCTYKFTGWVKAASTSGYSYPSLKPYDADKLFISTYHCREGFNLSTMTTLKQQLKTGDTKIYVNDLSAWNANSGHYYDVAAIFSYTDGQGYTWPDGIYTRNCPAFASSTEAKTNLDKTNNIITLLTAYTGPTMPAGTKVCASTYGSTYFYPWGGISNSSIADWTYKEGTFSSENVRMECAKYIRVYAYSTCYQAGMTLSNLTVDNLTANIEYDTSGFCNNGTKTGTFTWTSDTPKYQVSTSFNGSNYIGLTPPDSEIQTVAFWVKWSSIPSTQTIGFIDEGSGLAFGLSYGNIIVSCQVAGAASCYNASVLSANNWYHIVVIKTGATTRKLYINAVEQTANSTTNYWSYINNELQIGKRKNTGEGITGWMSDFRMYATALSADDVKSLYQNCATIDADGTIHGQIRS